MQHRGVSSRSGILPQYLPSWSKMVAERADDQVQRLLGPAVDVERHPKLRCSKCCRATVSSMRPLREDVGRGGLSRPVHGVMPRRAGLMYRSLCGWSHGHRRMKTPRQRRATPSPRRSGAPTFPNRRKHHSRRSGFLYQVTVPAVCVLPPQVPASVKTIEPQCDPLLRSDASGVCARWRDAIDGHLFNRHYAREPRNIRLFRSPPTSCRPTRSPHDVRVAERGATSAARRWPHRPGPITFVTAAVSRRSRSGPASDGSAPGRARTFSGAPTNRNSAVAEGRPGVGRTSAPSPDQVDPCLRPAGSAEPAARTAAPGRNVFQRDVSAPARPTPGAEPGARPRQRRGDPAVATEGMRGGSARAGPSRSGPAHTLPGRGFGRG